MMSSIYDDIGNDKMKLTQNYEHYLLRGPQGTLFGSNSIGGTVRNIPNPPDLQELEGAAKIGHSSTEGEGGSNSKIEGGS